MAHKALLDLTSPYLSTIISYNLFPYLLFIPVTEKYFFLFFKDQACFCFGSCCYSLCLEYFVPPMPYFCMVGFFCFFFNSLGLLYISVAFSYFQSVLAAFSIISSFKKMAFIVICYVFKNIIYYDILSLFICLLSASAKI